MATAVQAIDDIVASNKLALNDLLERADKLSEEQIAGEFSKLQADGLWSAIRELALRIDHAPQVASRLAQEDINRSLRGL